LTVSVLVLLTLALAQGCAKSAAPAQQPARPTDETKAAGPATTRARSTPATTQVSEATTLPAAPATQGADPIAHAPATAPTTAATTQAAAVAPAPRTVDQPNAALAERFAQMAQNTLRMQVLVDSTWRMAADLLEAAARLQPDEPRFARMLVEARLRGGDIPGAIDALATYRRLVPSDQHAQVEQIDLYLTRMETADAKLAYLESLIAAEDAIAAEVRSHAAVRAAQTRLERSQPGQAQLMLDQALELNPLNTDALRLRLTTAQEQTREQRVSSFLAWLRASPGDPAVAAALADELADAGHHRAALDWFGQAMSMYRRTNMQPGPQFAINYIAAMHLAGARNDAETGLAQVLGSDPTNIEAWLLRLAIARGSGDAAQLETAQREAAVALTNRLALLRQAAGDKQATTQPISAPGPIKLPDPGPILQQLSGTGRNELLEEFGHTASAIAWLKIYFEQKPVEAVPWVGVLRSMYGEENPLVTRLEGWSFLMAERPDEARVKLSAIADRDPVAALGMIRLADPAEKARTDAAARALLGEYPSGSTGVLLAEALRERGIQPDPVPDAAAVTEALEKFPKDFMEILGRPEMFYNVRLDPVQVGHGFGEPILVRVSLHNIGRDAITIGSQGAIERHLWLDAQLRGIAQNSFVGVAQDRLGGPLVLRPGESISQVVRLDQGDLNQFLSFNPSPMLQLSAAVTTNPTMSAAGPAPGLAGMRASLTRLIQRTGSPLNPEGRQRLEQALSDGSAGEKVRALELLATFAQILSRGEANEEMKAVAAQFGDLIRRAVNDPQPGVRAWAGYLSAAISSAQDRAAFVQQLAGGDWMQRLLAVRLVAEGAAGKDVAAKLAKNSDDPLVQSYAAATLDLLAVAATQPAATQPGPATAPTTKPTTVPAAAGSVPAAP
jgi:hypothetical protein